jgi:hypothetical protein
MTEEYQSAKGVAKAIGTDARTLRKFLRSEASPFEPVGQGGRYAFDAEDVAILKKAFDKEQAKKKTPTKPQVIEVEPVEADDPTPLTDEDEDWLDQEPDDDELLELEEELEDDI